MNEIVRREQLSENVFLFEVKAPRIARKRKAGQFVILRLHERGERFPLTVADADPDRGTITLIVQAVGKSTMQMGRLQEGDAILDLVGPLGKPTPISKVGTVVAVGGGIGVAVVYPGTQALQAAGNTVIGIIGARTKGLLILEQEMRAACDELFISTDDGSYGHHGFVSDLLQRLIDEGRQIDEVLAVGPAPMMRAVCDLTEPHGIKTLVSLNPIMVDGTGMCGGCRVLVGGETKFTCVDGPEFDGHQVDFEELIKRQRMYERLEEEAHACYLADVAARAPAS
ncbi:MAG: sulfide/dihydroorotate dehydrogenase-like FAD/NAD-binding protein [Armatimonadota bacterium]